jgi:signal transduction histidine kinase
VKIMPTALAHLFGRGSRLGGADRAYGLRIAASLLGEADPRRACEAACRLARRWQPCSVALVAAWGDSGGPATLHAVAGGARHGDVSDILEALGGRHSPLHDLGDQPLWLRLEDDPFRQGANALRRVDLRWLLALPLTVQTPAGPRRWVAVLAGGGGGVQDHAPVPRDARLVWRAVRNLVASGVSGDLDTAVNGRSAGWPIGGEAWQLAPAALAVVAPDRVAAVNARAVDLLERTVGADPRRWRAWLLGAVQRQVVAGRDEDVVAVGADGDARLRVTVTPAGDGAGYLLALAEVAPMAHAGAGDADEPTLRMLGHELRSPMTALRTSLDLVLRGDTGALTEDQTRFLGTARRNLDRLNRLLSDLLDAGSARAGSLNVQCESVDLGRLLCDDLALHALEGAEKGVPVDLSGVPASFTACVDAAKVQQMAHNVVSNAVKYTPRGGRVRVWLHGRAETDPGCGARLARAWGLPVDVFTLVVEDSGMGMSEEYLAGLFRPFHRDRRAEQRGLPGSGLGLHITRGLAEAHGGVVRLESRSGQGTTVWLALPRDPSTGRLLEIGRQVEQLWQAATGARLDARVVQLDLRDRLGDRPGDGDEHGREAVDTEVRGFLARLAAESRHQPARHVLENAGGVCCWQPAPGLWVGVALDARRLDAAWQVACAAPEAADELTDTAWTDCAGWNASKEMESRPVVAASPRGSDPATGGP